ncbi:hypothetical protein [Ammoniphilus sp. 3BR4]|uniref:hypothetical protein n=1 Tax=Ammoniphilus sp. 3BR4 TaxID=3158265 RepID=UPI003465D8C9
MPPFISALKSLLDDLASWMMFLVPGILVVTLVIGGILLAKADDGVETKHIKDRMGRVVIGAAIAGGATWLGKYIWGLFGGGV